MAVHSYPYLSAWSTSAYTITALLLDVNGFRVAWWCTPDSEFGSGIRSDPMAPRLLACQLKMGTLFCFLRRIFYSAKLTQCGWMECFSLRQEWQKWALCDGNLAVRSSGVSSSIGFELRNWVMGLSAPQRRFTVEAAWRDELVCVLQNGILECRLERLTRLRDLSIPHIAAVRLYRGSSNHILRHLVWFPHL